MHDARTFILTAIVGAALWGCANSPPFQIGAPVLDSHFGEAVTRAKQMQIVNPQGVDVYDQSYSGKAAHTAINRYESSGSGSAAQSASSTPSTDAAAKNGK